MNHRTEITSWIKSSLLMSWIIYILAVSPIPFRWSGSVGIIMIVITGLFIRHIPSHIIFTQPVILFCLVFPEIFISLKAPREPYKYYLPDGTVKYRVSQDIQGNFSGNLIDFTTIHYAQPRFCRFIIDANGYRNSGVKPDEAQIITIGDSYTFGMISQDQIWPVQLSNLTGLKVYNLGITNYAPEQSIRTLENFLNERNRPPRLQTVILMLFHGNDLSDNLLSDWQSFRQQNESILTYSINYLGEKKNSTLLNQLIKAYILRNGKSSTTLPIRDYTGDTTLLARSFMDETLQSREMILHHAHFSSICQALNRFKQLAEHFHFKAIVVTAPSKELVLIEKWSSPQDNAEFNTYFTHYSDSIGLIHCDLTPEFKHQSQSLTLYLSDDT
ncbi:MAG: hypothetical protein KBA26_05965, partial [Candidatus Delongbacteria bacterium]|nr:hypothetical protein [Candidatus Delongbacteria bacterium]